MGQSSVKASIKLRFNNTHGSSMVVARSMEVTQKKTTASFKALDGTIRGEREEHSLLFGGVQTYPGACGVLSPGRLFVAVAGGGSTQEAF